MSAPEESIELARVAGQAAADKLAGDVIALDVSEQLVITDVFLVCSGTSDRHVAGIVDGIEEEMLKQLGRKPVRREGERDARWVLLDYSDIVVHVQHAEDRAFYALERLWRDAPVIDLQLDDAPSANAPVTGAPAASGPSSPDAADGDTPHAGSTGTADSRPAS